MAKAPPATPQTKSKTYDFTPVKVGLNHGPTLQTQATAGFVRDPDTIRVAIIRHTERLSECLRFALSGKRMRVTVSPGQGTFVSTEIALTIDPFGIATSVAVKTDAAPLARCMEETLTGMRVNRRTPRETRAEVTLFFRNLHDVKPAQKPPPAVGIREGRPGCMLARDPLPVDNVKLETLAIDFDPPAETGSSWRRCDSYDVDKATIRTAVNTNLGGLRACYIDARTREPALTGIVNTHFVIGPWGELAELTIDGAGDTAFHDCVKAALAQVAVPYPSMQRVIVNLPFDLVADDVDQVTEIVARAKAATTVDAACVERVKLFDHYSMLARGSDSRSVAAMTAVLKFIAAHDRTTLATCVTEARASLIAFARWPTRGDRGFERWRGGGLAEALERTQLVLTAFPELKHDLLSFLGHALITLRRPIEAREAFLEFLTLGVTDKTLVEAAADGYSKATNLVDVWDDCEARARY